MTRTGITITTVEELETLPVGSVVLDLGPNRTLDNAPVIACKTADGMWHITGTPKDRRWRHHEIIRDATGSTLIAVHIPGEKESSQADVPASHHGENSLGHSTICAWCLNIARGNAWHNDGRPYPSCGATDHGQGWVPEHHPLPDRDTIAQAIVTGYEIEDMGINDHDLKAADAVLELLKGNREH